MRIRGLYYCSNLFLIFSILSEVLCRKPPLPELAAQAVPPRGTSATGNDQPHPPPQQLAQLLLPAPLYVLMPVRTTELKAEV